MRMTSIHPPSDQSPAGSDRDPVSFQTILAAVADAVVATDAEGRILAFNPAAEQIFQYSAADVLGHNISQLLDSFEPWPGRGQVARLAGRRPAESTPPTGSYKHSLAASRRDGASRESRGLRRDGTCFPIEIAVSEVQSAGQTLVTAVVRDITERKEAEARMHWYTRELEEAREQLERQTDSLRRQAMSLDDALAAAEEAGRAKTRFLSKMSHELRTPLTSILGYAEVLMEGALTGEQRQAADAVRRNGAWLLSLLEEILNFADLEDGRIALRPEPCSPREIVAGVAAEVEERRQAKGLRLLVEHDAALPPQVLTDPGRLCDVLLHLVTNAITFTEAGEVAVTTRWLALNGSVQQLEVEVRDTGIGISPERMAVLYSPFEAETLRPARGPGGLGLGLSISRRLAQLLGGSLEAQSELGVGSRFTLRIAVGQTSQPAPMSEAPAPSEPAEPGCTSPIATQPTPGRTPLSCRVLVAEDSPDSQRLFRAVLTKAGATVVVADNGQMAVDSALAAVDENAPFDLILMDMQMPILDGYDATRQLRSAGYSHPIVALTAEAMSYDRAKCLGAGCDDYATKPIVREQLIALVAQYAESAKAAKAAKAVEAAEDVEAAEAVETAARW